MLWQGFGWCNWLRSMSCCLFKLLVHDENSRERSAELEYAQLRAINTVSFLENLLGDSPYFASEQLHWQKLSLEHLFIECRIWDCFNQIIQDWMFSERLLSRPTWQQIELSSEDWSNFNVVCGNSEGLGASPPSTNECSISANSSRVIVSEVLTW